MGYNDELERQAVVNREKPSPVYGVGQKGVTIPGNTTLENYIDVVSGTATFAKDSDLTDGTIKATFDTVAATSNGLGKNFKVGDDAYIGDINKTNTIVVAGVVNGDRGFIQFGSGSQPSIGHNSLGGFPAVTDTQSVSGSLLIKASKLYIFNGGASNNGWTLIA
jgi:hypothetical protein